MSLSAAVIDAMVASGVTVEQLAAVMKADLAESNIRLQSKREADADRQRRSRANRRVSRNVTVTPRDGCDTPPNDIYSNPPEPSGAKAPATPFSEIVVQAWNEGPGKAGATLAKPLDDGRRKALTVRLREHGEEAVLEAIRNLSGSPWHCGKNDRGWQANIGWLLKSPENFQKALEMGPKQKQADPGPDFLDHISSKYQVAA